MSFFISLSQQYGSHLYLVLSYVPKASRADPCIQFALSLKSEIHFKFLFQAKTVQEQICTVQGPLLEELNAGVAVFAQDVDVFDEDFDANGPMVPGLSAREASDRVLLFQDRFDELWRRFEMYSSGEALFGLEVKDYPALHKRKKEFNLLNKLYGLYLAVNQSIDGYYDLLWSDVDTEIIFAELQEFQNRYNFKHFFI